MEVIKKRPLCVVHIGMPKTGSTALQECFYKSLLDDRVSYGNLPEPNQSVWIYGLFVRDYFNYHMFKYLGLDSHSKVKDFRNEAAKRLIHGFLNHKTEIELLSGEDLFHLSSNEVIDFKNFLAPYFEKVIIVAYVRPLKSFLESAFQQMVKQQYINNFEPKSIYHRYRNFEIFDNIFGVENVKLLKYDASIFPQGNVILDFAKNMGFLFAENNLTTVNESSALESISVLFNYHRHPYVKTDFGIMLPAVQHGAMMILKKIGSTPFRFSDEYIESVKVMFKDDYSWIQARMHGSLNDNFMVSDSYGVSTENDLIEYSITCIDQLVILLNDTHIPFVVYHDAVTVAKLMDLLMRNVFAKISSNGLGESL